MAHYLMSILQLKNARIKLVTKWESFANYWRTTQLEYTWLRSLMNRHKDFWQITEGKFREINESI